MRELCLIPTPAVQLAVCIDRPDTPDTQPVPVVLVVHGLTGSKLGKAYHLAEFAERLCAAGIACVRFDQAGCGDSTGRFIDLSLTTMLRDARAVAAWLAATPWADGVRRGVLGLSLGALPAVTVDAESGFASLALWAGVYDLPGVFTATTPAGLSSLVAHQGWVPYRGLKLGSGFFASLGAVDTGSALGQGRGPVLLAHSPSDAVVPFDQSVLYAERCAALGRAYERLAIDGADHDFSDFAHRQLLLESTVAFFARTLRGAA